MPLTERALLELLERPPAHADRRLVYGDAPEQIVDWFEHQPSPRTLVLAIHGGFWRAAYDNRHLSHAARAWARGRTVASLEYRRSGQPGGGYPGTLDDVVLAARTAVRACPSATRVVLIGHSAGGQLALWLAAERERWCESVQIAGVVALAPVADLLHGHALGLGGGAIEAFMGAPPNASYAHASPAARLPLGVRQIVIHGERDDQVPLAASVRYVEAARAAGDHVDLWTLPGADHYCIVHPDAEEFLRVQQALEVLG